MATTLEYRNHGIVHCKGADALREANLAFCNEFNGVEADRGKRRITIEILSRQLLGVDYGNTENGKAIQS